MRDLGGRAGRRGGSGGDGEAIGDIGEEGGLISGCGFVMVMDGEGDSMVGSWGCKSWPKSEHK